MRHLESIAKEEQKQLQVITNSFGGMEQLLTNK